MQRDCVQMGEEDWGKRAQDFSQVDRQRLVSQKNLL